MRRMKDFGPADWITLTQGVLFGLFLLSAALAWGLRLLGWIQ